MAARIARQPAPVRRPRQQQGKRIVGTDGTPHSTGTHYRTQEIDFRYGKSWFIFQLAEQLQTYRGDKPHGSLGLAASRFLPSVSILCPSTSPAALELLHIIALHFGHAALAAGGEHLATGLVRLALGQ